MAIAGVALLIPRWKGRWVAGASLLTLSVLSGLEILPIKELVPIKDLTLFHYTRNHASQPEGYSLQTLSLAVENMIVAQFPWDKVPVPPLPPPPPPFYFSLALPPFDPGSAELHKHLRCPLHTLARKLAEDRQLSSIMVVGRGDRRELRPVVRRKYATNWGIAQQRAACVEKVLRHMQVRPEKILVTSAGPLLTLYSTPTAGLDPDRAVTLLIAGSGATPEHPWTEGLEPGAEYRACDTQVEPPWDLCHVP